MGRGGGKELGAASLLYGRKTYQDAALDSSDPSTLARRRAESLLEAYERGDLTAFLKGISGTELQRFGDTPLVEELLTEITQREVDALIKQMGVKRRAKGAADERSDLTRSLVRVAHQRASELLNVPEDERPKTILDQNQLKLAALRRPGGGPITDEVCNRISVGTGLRGINNNEVLELLLSDRASDQAREALDSNLRRTARDEFRSIHSLITSSYRYHYSDHFSEVAGYLRRSSGSLTLHLRHPEDRWRTVCGKWNMRSGPYGSWRDAEASPKYRRCKKCEGESGSELTARAESERRDLLPVAGPNAEAISKELIENPVVQRALRKAAKTEDPAAAEAVVREAMSQGLTDLTFEQLQDENGKPAVHTLWGRIPYGLRNQLMERGVTPSGFEPKVPREVLDQVIPPETLKKVVAKGVQRRQGDLRDDLEASQAGNDAIDRLISKAAAKFIKDHPPLTED
jgi:hypothetical protein